uniref:Junctional adhesion molecule 2a n=1 Tax=Gasterosteus aculeatus aculeatus TaxID=481459 RepID=A0AAQ4REX6_GASAC
MMEGTSLCLPVVILLVQFPWAHSGSPAGRVGRGAQCPAPAGSPSFPVTVSTDRHKVEVKEFSDAVLSCTFRTEKDQNPRIEWKKKGKDVSFVYFDGNFKAPFEDRATINGATVTLRRVTQDDAGEYRCEISAPLDAVILGETNVTLKVLVPPHTPSCEIPSAAVTGSVVQMLCRDQQSIPPATYSWFKDSQPMSQPRRANATYLINPHTGVLVRGQKTRFHLKSILQLNRVVFFSPLLQEFKAVAKEDTGRYSCLASNGVGTPKMCEGKHMTIEDVNVSAVVAAVLVVCLVVVVCGCGGYLLHRSGFFSRESSWFCFFYLFCFFFLSINAFALTRPN